MNDDIDCIVVLICISLRANEVEDLLLLFIAYLNTSFLSRMCSSLLSIFPLDCFLFPIGFVRVLYPKCLFSDINIAIFLPLWLTVVLNVIVSNLSDLFFMMRAFCGLLRSLSITRTWRISYAFFYEHYFSYLNFHVSEVGFEYCERKDQGTFSPLMDM